MAASLNRVEFYYTNGRLVSRTNSRYDRVYGAFWDMVIEQDGKAVVKQSAERYLRAIGR